MGLLRHHVRNSSLAKESSKKDSKPSNDYAGAFWNWIIGISIFIGVWFFITAMIWAIDRSMYEPTTKTLFQYIGAQWEWVKDTFKHIF